MWRQVVQAQGASTSRCCARQSKRLGAARPAVLCTTSKAAPPHGASHRALSSAQPSPWDDGSPFLMSTAPSLAQIQNPTAERVVMKTFLNTLQVTAVQSDAVETEPLFRSEETVVKTVKEETAVVSDDGGLQVIEEEQTSVVTVTSLVVVPEKETEDERDSSESIVTSDAKESEQESDMYTPIKKNPSHGRLLHAIRTKNLEMAKQAFRECLQQNVTIQAHYLVQLFNLVVTYDPITALQVLRNYRQVTGEPAHSALYAKLCESVGTVHWKLAQTGQFTKMVNDLREDLVGLDEAYQRRCFPVMLVSLAQQPMHRIGRMASGLYKFMVKNDYPLSHGKMRHLLNVSRFTRQDDLSFPTILARLVEEGQRPYPPLAIHVLQNLFPYTNLDETIIAMKAIIELQSSWEPGDSYPTYKVDIGTLEHVMAAAARKGSFELNILVWDLVDLLGYEPTECMYENTVQGFVMGVRQDHNVFAVLGEMEERGFPPSRALIRSLSRSLRFSERRVDFSYNLLTSQETEGARITCASLNAVLSAAAELGDVDRAFATFDDFDLYEVEPNADTYSFLLEALSVSVSSRVQKSEEQRKLDAPGRMDAASAILSLMEENEVRMCQHCIEHYARLLYNVGRLDAATEFLLDSLERGDPVSNRIIIVMSKHNAMAGNIEVARLLATKTTEPFGHLEHRITEIEKQLLAADKGDEDEQSESDETESDESHD